MVAAGVVVLAVGTAMVLRPVAEAPPTLQDAPEAGSPGVEAQPYAFPSSTVEPISDPQRIRTSTAVNLTGLLTLFVLGMVVWKVLDARPARRKAAPPLTVEELAARLHRKELKYGVLGAILVVLSGMSFQYFPNPTFGSAGDYLSMLLWGTAVGEGVKLARRFLPQSPQS